MSKFSTKMYTRPVLVNNIKKLSSNAFSSVDALASALSPRAGRRSAQFAALKSVVNLNKVFSSSTGSSIKTNILRTLQG